MTKKLFCKSEYSAGQVYKFICDKWPEEEPVPICHQAGRYIVLDEDENLQRIGEILQDYTETIFGIGNYHYWEFV